MTNYRKGEVEVDFGSKSLLIRFTLNAVCVLEQNLEAPFHTIISNMGYNTVREALFVGLRAKGNRKITRAEIGTLMESSELGFNYYAAAVLEGIQAATGMSLAVAISALRGEDDDDEDDESTEEEGADSPPEQAPEAQQNLTGTS